MRGWLSWHPSLYGSTFDGDIGGLKESQQQPDLSQQQDSQPNPTTDGRPRRRSFGSHEPSTYGALETNGQVGLLSLTDTSGHLGQLPSHMSGQGYAAPVPLNDHGAYGGLQLGGYPSAAEPGMIGQLPMGVNDFVSPAPVLTGGAMIGQASTSGQFSSGGFAGLIGQTGVGGRPNEPPPAVQGPNFSRIGEHAPIGQTDLSDWRRRQAMIQQSSLFSAAGPLPNGGVGGGPQLGQQTAGTRPMYSSVGQSMSHNMAPPVAAFKAYLPQPSLSWNVGNQIGQLHHPEIGLSLQGDYPSMGRAPDIGSIDPDMQGLTISTRRTGSSSMGKQSQLTGTSNVGAGPSGRDSPQRTNSGNLDQTSGLDSPGGGRSHSLDSAGISNYSEVSERRDVFPSRSSSLTQQFDRNALFQGGGQGMVGELIDRRRSSMDVHDAPAYPTDMFASSRRACGESTFGRAANSIDLRRGSLDVRRASIDIGQDRMLGGFLGSPGPSSRAGSGAPRVPPDMRRTSMDVSNAGPERHPPSLYTTAGPVLGASSQRAVAMQQSHGWGGAPFKLKVICSSGGHFVRNANGAPEYAGGETRLVSVTNFCNYNELRDSVERLCSEHQKKQQTEDRVSSSSAGSDHAIPVLMPVMKYLLPTEPNTYVDLRDDEDVHMMFDEWADFTLAHPGTTAKLCIYIEWLPRPGDTNLIRGDELAITSGNSATTQRSDSAEVLHSPHTAAGEAPQESTLVTKSSRASRKTGQHRYDLDDIAERMEIISPNDIELVKFLGAGGYGEVYLGKWHNSECAVKCLNQSLFFSDGPGGQVSMAAITDLIHEADLLGGLRHPNVVWVYGIVLPRLDDSDVTGCKGDSSDAVEIAAAVAKKGNRNGAVNTGGVRAPAIVCEFLSQGSLKGALSRKADVVCGALLRILIALDAAKGMEYLHGKRIVHFDLKSANLLLGYRERRAICKVADFGLSKQKRETYVSGVSSQRGTLPWIAPEIIKTPHAVTEKVDVFSFGVVMWELWTGREPYEGLNYHALLHQITSSTKAIRPAIPGNPDWEGEPLPELAPGWRDLMERCWEELPDKRPRFTDIVGELAKMAESVRPPRKPRGPFPGAPVGLGGHALRHEH